MWQLVLIVIAMGVPSAEKMSQHKTINGCFFAREALLLEYGKGSEYFPVNIQAVCIQTDNK